MYFGSDLTDSVEIESYELEVTDVANGGGDNLSFNFSMDANGQVSGSWGYGPSVGGGGAYAPLGGGTLGGSNRYPPLTGIQPITTDSANSRLLCLAGHVTDGETIEYADGVLVTNCTQCGDRIILAAVPGGISFLRIKTLLGAVLALDEDTMQLEGFDLSSLMGTFKELSDSVEVEEFAVEQARKLLDLAERALAGKVREAQTTDDSADL